MLWSAVDDKNALKAWRAPLCGLVIAGLLLGLPFTSAAAGSKKGDKGHAAAKGSGHSKTKGQNSGSHKGRQAQTKRQGPNRHHSEVQSAKKHRQQQQHKQPVASHKPGRGSSSSSSSRSRSSSSSSSSSGSSNRPMAGWRRGYWGPHPWGPHYWGHYWGANYWGPVGVPVAAPIAATTGVFTVHFRSAWDQKNHSVQVTALSPAEAKAKVLAHHPDAIIKSVE